MNFRLTKITAIIMAAAAFVIVPGTYVMTSDAATKLVASFGTTLAAGQSNRVALEAETFTDVVQPGGFASMRDAETRAVAAAKTVGGVESVKNDVRVR